MEGAEISHKPLPPHRHSRPLVIITQQSGTFITIAEPTLTHHYPQISSFTLGSLSVLYILWVWTNV